MYRWIKIPQALGKFFQIPGISRKNGFKVPYFMICPVILVMQRGKIQIGVSNVWQNVENVENWGKTYLEVENNRPNQPKNKFWIPIDNIFSSDVNKPYLEYFLI